MRIDRCICFDRSFAELKEIARRKSSDSIEALQRHVEFGLQCELCHPYVRRMLRTGEVRFGEILTDEDEPSGQDLR
ncbi:MAG: (2Fe-2S)-binding protein [Rhodothermales bacterium]